MAKIATNSCDVFNLYLKNKSPAVIMTIFERLLLHHCWSIFMLLNFILCNIFTRHESILCIIVKWVVSPKSQLAQSHYINQSYQYPQTKPIQIKFILRVNASRPALQYIGQVKRHNTESSDTKSPKPCKTLIRYLSSARVHLHPRWASRLPDWECLLGALLPRARDPGESNCLEHVFQFRVGGQKSGCPLGCPKQLF